MRAAITPQTRIVFVANPEQPDRHVDRAGACSRRSSHSVPRDVLVVLDEAYNEYLEPADRADSVGWIARYPNLVVSRSFSKAYGLAALRIGYGVMSDRGRRHVQPRAPAVQRERPRAGRRHRGARRHRVSSTRAARAQPRRARAALRAASTRSAFPYVPSHGNFVLVKVGDAARVNHALLLQGVIVRPVASYGLPEWLRVSVGLPAENERFLAALKSALGR